MNLNTWTPNYYGSFQYRAAQVCAEEYMIKNPTLASDWVYDDGKYFGGNNTDLFVGVVPNYTGAVKTVNMMDGGSGLRNICNGTTIDSLSWPVGAAQSATFSPEFAYYIGDIGSGDFLNVGADTQLGPGLCLHRVPTCGRNWEYAGGEDAYLASGQKEWVEGLQKNKVMATLKHFALNSQELNRNSNIAQISEASMMESYMPTFAHAIKGAPGAVMCSYNRVQIDERNDTISYLCGDDYMLTNVLKDTLGFGGLVMTDWTNNDRVDLANGTSYQNRAFDWEMNWGQPLSREFISDKQRKTAVHNSLSGMVTAGIFKPDSDNCACENSEPKSRAPSIRHLPKKYRKQIKKRDNRGLAAIVSAESMVLLKNDGALPLTKRKIKKILLTGEYMLNGGGSGDSGAFAYFLPDPTVEGLVTGGLYGQVKMKDTLAEIFDAEVYWDYEVDEVEVDGKLDCDDGKYDVILAFGSQYRSEEYMVQSFIGKGDGFYNLDRCNSTVARENITMTYGDCDYEKLINKYQTARRKGSKLISIATHGGVYMTHDHINNVDAALSTYYPGEQLYNALAQVLSGKISPGGKLINTLPGVDEKDGMKYLQSPISRFNKGLSLDNPAPELYYNETGTQYYGLVTPAYEYDEHTGKHTDVIQYGYNASKYIEENLVGYKYYEKYSIQPMFQFGFGLTYLEKSELEKVKIEMDSKYKVHVKIDIDMKKPDWKMIASDVVQVYIGYESDDVSLNKNRPLKELKGFKKVWSSGKYDIDIGSTNYSWDIKKQQYVLPCEKDGVNGKFTVYVGFNSANIIEKKGFDCKVN